MNIDSIDQVLGIMASAVAILTFFGIAQYVDTKKLFSDNKTSATIITSSVPSTGGASTSSKKMLNAIIGGGIGGAIGGLIFSLAFRTLFYPFTPAADLIIPVLGNSLTSAVCVAIGASAVNAAEGVLKGTIVGGVISGILIIFVTINFSPYWNIALIIYSLMQSTIFAAESSLIGVAGNTQRGVLIGAVGGAITGVINGMLFGAAGLIVGLFIGIVSDSIFGAIAGSFLSRK